MPYDNDHMIYDYNKHIYVVTAKTIENELGEDVALIFGSNEKANIQINRICRNLYSWIYSQVHPASKRYVEYMLACYTEYRDVLQEALISQIEYALESSGNALGSQHGIDVVKGTAIDIKSMRGRVLVSAQAEQVLRASGILYAGTYNYTIASASYRVGY